MFLLEKKIAIISVNFKCPTTDFHHECGSTSHELRANELRVYPIASCELPGCKLRANEPASLRGCKLT